MKTPEKKKEGKAKDDEEGSEEESEEEEDEDDEDDEAKKEAEARRLSALRRIEMAEKFDEKPYKKHIFITSRVHPGES